MYDTDTRTILTLAVENNLGYSATQVVEREQTMTLGALLSALTEAVETYGEDALIVTQDTSVSGRYSAGFGSVSVYSDTITLAKDDEEEDEGY